MRKAIIVLMIVFLSSCEMIMPAQVELAGVIRRSGGTPWAVINDGGHTPVGIKSVVETDKLICINYDFTANTIYSFSVTVDETMASLGYFVGASVGLDHANIYVYKLDNGVIIPVDPQTIDESSGNFWIYGLFGF